MSKPIDIFNKIPKEVKSSMTQELLTIEPQEKTDKAFMPAQKTPDPFWNKVSTEDARSAIKGSVLEPIVSALESVANPPLPLELTLGKAIALAGAAMSYPVNEYRFLPRKDKGFKNSDDLFGPHLLKLKLDTAGGQACNIFSLTVAPSGTGKDIGNMLATLSSINLGLSMGTSGSAEGIKDALINVGNGLFEISEFAPYLDPTTWQGKAMPFLTDSFNKGKFREVLSSRTKNVPREARFAYPSLVANIQESVLQSIAHSNALTSGFLPRFLVTLCGKIPPPRPSTRTVARPESAHDALKKCKESKGIVSIPENYMGKLMNRFYKAESSIQSVYSRYINEYGARIATILAIVNQDGGNNPPIVTPEHLLRAEIIIQWFYRQAHNLYIGLEQNSRERIFENKCQRMLAWIKSNAPCTQSKLSKNTYRIASGKLRYAILNELVERGEISVEKADGSKTTIIAYIEKE